LSAKLLRSSKVERDPNAGVVGFELFANFGKRLGERRGGKNDQCP
jgi:hypothetical protein